jgi:predicted transcriptional regulator of viral defense system
MFACDIPDSPDWGGNLGDTAFVTPRVQSDSLSINVGNVRQWQVAGLTISQFRQMIRSGELVRVRRGVYTTARHAAAVKDKPASEHALQVAAAVSAQSTRGAVASHQSAAQIHGIDLIERPGEDVVWLTRAPGRYRESPASGIRYRAAALPQEHVAEILGVRVTTAARTVLDLARSLPYTEGVAAADSALNKRLVTKPELARLLKEFDRWPGVTKARRVVDFSDELAESVLESAARVAFAQFGLPAPQLQTDIYDDKLRLIGRVDFLWEDQRTVGEADGMVKYEEAGREGAQIRRDIRLRDASYKVVHFTWAELFGEPARVIARFRGAFTTPNPY